MFKLLHYLNKYLSESRYVVRSCIPVVSINISHIRLNVQSTESLTIFPKTGYEIQYYIIIVSETFIQYFV